METKARLGAKEAHILLLVLLMLSDTIGSPVYSIAVVLYAAVLTVIFDPVYLLPACFLTTTIQSFFLITPSLSFENLRFSALAAWDEMLTTQYGDYMQLPAENERRIHPSRASWR